MHGGVQERVGSVAERSDEVVNGHCGERGAAEDGVAKREPLRSLRTAILPDEDAPADSVSDQPHAMRQRTAMICVDDGALLETFEASSPSPLLNQRTAVPDGDGQEMHDERESRQPSSHRQRSALLFDEMDLQADCDEAAQPQSQHRQRSAMLPLEEVQEDSPEPAQPKSHRQRSAMLGGREDSSARPHERPVVKNQRTAMLVATEEEEKMIYDCPSPTRLREESRRLQNQRTAMLPTDDAVVDLGSPSKVATA